MTELQELLATKTQLDKWRAASDKDELRPDSLYAWVEAEIARITDPYAGAKRLLASYADPSRRPFTITAVQAQLLVDYYSHLEQELAQAADKLDKTLDCRRVLATAADVINSLLDAGHITSESTTDCYPAVLVRELKQLSVGAPPYEYAV